MIRTITSLGKNFDPSENSQEKEHIAKRFHMNLYGTQKKKNASKKSYQTQYMIGEKKEREKEKPMKNLMFDWNKFENQFTYQFSQVSIKTRSWRAVASFSEFITFLQKRFFLYPRLSTKEKINTITSTDNESS